MFRYALCCEAVLVLQKNQDKISKILGVEVDIGALSKIILNALEGEVYKSIIYTDLKQAGVSYWKYRHSDNEEIDLIIGNDLYEKPYFRELREMIFIKRPKAKAVATVKVKERIPFFKSREPSFLNNNNTLLGFLNTKPRFATL
jgi:hypothetical protein